MEVSVSQPLTNASFVAFLARLQPQVPTCVVCVHGNNLCVSGFSNIRACLLFLAFVLYCIMHVVSVMTPASGD